jgi:hypothetical protein
MKRMVMAFNGKRTIIDPQFCDHRNAIVTYDDVDGRLRHCPDCDSTIDDQGNVIKAWDGEIPFMEEK